MNNQIQSQIFGFILALGTAIGCIAYERLVKQYSYGVILWLNFIYYSVSMIIFSLFDKKCLIDIKYISFNWSWAAAIYLITGFTSILWYIITKRQSVMTGGIYELKYIVMLALMYLIWGEKEMGWNTVIGLIFSILSIYFISK